MKRGCPTNNTLIAKRKVLIDEFDLKLKVSKLKERVKETQVFLNKTKSTKTRKLMDETSNKTIPEHSKLSFSERLKLGRNKLKEIESKKEERSKGFDEKKENNTRETLNLTMKEFEKNSAYTIDWKISNLEWESFLTGPSYIPINAIKKFHIEKKNSFMEYITIGTICSILSASCSTFFLLKVTNLESDFVFVLFFDKLFKKMNTFRVGDIYCFLNLEVILGIEHNYPVALVVDNFGKILKIGETSDIGYCQKEVKNAKCDIVLNNKFCNEHAKEEIELMRRKRQFLVDSVVLIGEPSQRSRSENKPDLNSSYFIPDGRLVSINKNEIKISVPWASKKRYANNQNRHLTKYEEKALKIEEKEDELIANFLSQKNTAGGKQLRASRNIKLIQTAIMINFNVNKMLERVPVFSVEDVKRMGFNPSTNELYREDIPERKKKDEKIEVVKETTNSNSETLEKEKSYIIFSDSENE
ncbi:hypothetical protein HDU92_003660 [Lobulomyces angularis]|nr:hypothetical protein HDU92_003660 [Lobulomyces angularis]